MVNQISINEELDLDFPSRILKYISATCITWSGRFNQLGITCWFLRAYYFYEIHVYKNGTQNSKLRYRALSRKQLYTLQLLELVVRAIILIWGYHTVLLILYRIRNSKSRIAVSWSYWLWLLKSLHFIICGNHS